MEISKDRPGTNLKPPALNESIELLKKLLEIEKERLEVAVRIEKERKIVFPETTVIIHDIIKLNDAILSKEPPRNIQEVINEFQMTCQ